MATNQHSQPPICGATYPATAKGFADFLAEANRVAADGYELITVVRLNGAKIAGVFRRRSGPPQEKPGGFFD